MRHSCSLFLVLAIGASFAPFSHAQDLTKADETKISALNVRKLKASSEEEKVRDTIKKFRVFLVFGDVRAGDTAYADIYGEAIQSTGAPGAGSISTKTYIRVLNPFADEYVGVGGYRGDCLFLGVIKGTNTYSPVWRDEDYVAARKALKKWQDIGESIQGEINMIYLPYEKRAKNQAQAVKKEEARNEAQAAIEATNLARAEVEVLKNNVSIVPGERLGKVSLGMTESQVLQLMGQPEQSTQLHKITRSGQYQSSWLPSKIRRDRYSLQATKGLEIFYQGTPQELAFFAGERSIEMVSDGDLKMTFVYDVFFVNGEVVQIASDSPQFFNSKKQNIQSADFDFENNYQDSIAGYRVWYGGVMTMDSGDVVKSHHSSYYFDVYTGDRDKGISYCLGFKVDSEPRLSFPYSRRMLIIHNPKTVPYTGDFQEGISVLNKKNGQSDADNVEERIIPGGLNP